MQRMHLLLLVVGFSSLSSGLVYFENIGEVTHGHLYRDHAILVSVPDNMVSSLNPKNHSNVHWRKVYETSRISNVVWLDNSLLVVFASESMVKLDYETGMVESIVELPVCADPHSMVVVDSLTVNDQFLALLLRCGDGDKYLVLVDLALDKVTERRKVPDDVASDCWLLTQNSMIFLIGTTASYKTSGLRNISFEPIAHTLPQPISCLRSQDDAASLRCSGTDNSLICILDPELTCRPEPKFVISGKMIQHSSTRFSIPTSSSELVVFDIGDSPASGNVQSVAVPSQFGARLIFGCRSDDGEMMMVMTDELTMLTIVHGQIVAKSDQALSRVVYSLHRKPHFVVATSVAGGLTLAINTDNGGSIAWRMRAPGDCQYRVSALLMCGSDDVIVYACESKVVIRRFDARTGKSFGDKIMRRRDGKPIFLNRKYCHLLDDRLVDMSETILTKSTYTWSLSKVDNQTIRCYRHDVTSSEVDAGSAVWQQRFGSEGSVIVSMEVKSDMSYHSDVVILADRSILHKRMERERLIVLAYDEAETSLFVYAIHIPTGELLYKTQHADTLGPFTLKGPTENWFVYSYRTPSGSRFPRTELKTVSMYNENVVSEIIAVLPSSNIQVMAVSRTLKAICGRSLFFASPAGHIYHANWQYAVESLESRDQLIQIKFVDQSIVNRDHMVRRLRSIDTYPHPELESITMYVAYGTDLAIGSTTPSKSFDALKHDFQRLFIASAVALMTVASMVSYYFAKRTQLAKAWQ